eukprot:m.402714 g.402714  ORF g.402714 m.402714 type:complete len:156 (-) comp21184_c0_seq6:574-1041(-)
MSNNPRGQCSSSERDCPVGGILSVNRSSFCVNICVLYSLKLSKNISREDIAIALVMTNGTELLVRFHATKYTSITSTHATPATTPITTGTDDSDDELSLSPPDAAMPSEGFKNKTADVAVLEPADETELPAQQPTTHYVRGCGQHFPTNCTTGPL